MLIAYLKRQYHVQAYFSVVQITYCLGLSKLNRPSSIGLVTIEGGMLMKISSTVTGPEARLPWFLKAIGGS